MNLGEWIARGGGVIVALLTLIQIVPVKVNPWSAIAKGLGKAINADVFKELEDVKSSQDDVKRTQREIKAQLADRIRVEDERNADSQRERILRFNVELMRNIPHTREDFIEILAVMDVYERYCKNHPDYKNNRAVHAISNINRIYDERQEKNDFYKADGKWRTSDPI